MVKSRLCETARLAFFSVRPRLSHFSNCETETFETAFFHEENTKKRSYFMTLSARNTVELSIEFPSSRGPPWAC